MKQDKRLILAELVISAVLRYGVLLCGGVLAIGLMLSWIRPEAASDFSGLALAVLLKGKILDRSAIPASASSLFHALGALDPSAFVSLGLIFLIALPILRVALTVALFVFEKDYLYFALTTLVLAILLGGVFFGKML